MPPSICASTTSGFTAMPQSHGAHDAVDLELAVLVDARPRPPARTTVPNDSCTAMPRALSPALPAASGCPSPPSRRRGRAPRGAADACASSARRNSTGSLPAAAASSSMIVSVEKAVWRRAHRAPPQHRHAVLRRVQLTAMLRDRRRAVSTRLRPRWGRCRPSPSSARTRAGEDRLADDAVVPADDVAVARRGPPSARARTSGGSSRPACRPRASTRSSPGCPACRSHERDRDRTASST